MLFRKYAERLPTSIGEIESLWAKVVAAADTASLKALHRALHSLPGSGETFGYKQLGSSARAMELAIAPCLGAAVLEPSLIESLSSMLAALKQAANAPDTPA